MVESGHDGHETSRFERNVALQKHDSQRSKRLTSLRLTVPVFACIVTYQGNSLITVANSLHVEREEPTAFRYSMLDSLFARAGHRESEVEVGTPAPTVPHSSQNGSRGYNHQPRLAVFPDEPIHGNHRVFRI